MERRSFLGALAAPAALHAAGQTAAPGNSTKIAAVEIWRVEGHRKALAGVNSQHQVQPLHVYEEYRPKPYYDNPNPVERDVPASAFYLSIKTVGGLEGLYGPVDREPATVIGQQLSRFLTGKDALAGEALWDQMHRSDRHSRRGHYMMAISALDNALWDLRGRYFNVPVYRLLGGPTRTSVEAYGSCLGYSIEPELAAKRAAALLAE